MSRLFVLAITGPTGSGKSTVGDAVAKQLHHCVNIDADYIKHMIVDGFYEDKNNAGWSFSQWELVGDSIGLLASNFLKEGYSVIINGYIDEPAWSAIEKHVELNHKKLNYIFQDNTLLLRATKLANLPQFRHLILTIYG